MSLVNWKVNLNFCNKKYSKCISIVGKKCKIAGWGEWDDDGLNKYPQFLQEVEVPIVDLDKCVSNYNDQNQQVVPTDFNFCAGGKQGIDSCFVILRIQGYKIFNWSI